MRSFNYRNWTLGLFYSCALLFLSSCSEGSLTGIGISEVSVAGGGEEEVLKPEGAGVEAAAEAQAQTQATPPLSLSTPISSAASSTTVSTLVGVDGRILTAARAGDVSDWVEIAQYGGYSLIVRANYINLHPNEVMSGKRIYGDPAWQHTPFGTTTAYGTSLIRNKINEWFNGAAPGAADKLPLNATLRDYTVYNNAGTTLGTSTTTTALTNGLSTPGTVSAPTGDDVAFALSYGEAANFVSLLHFLRGVYIANQPGSAVAVANYAKISIPTSYAYYGMWLRSPGDLPNTVGFLSNSFSQVVPGRVFQEYLTGRGLIYPALWVKSEIFSSGGGGGGGGGGEDPREPMVDSNIFTDKDMFTEEKIYNKMTLDDDFADDTVLVVLTKAKTWSQSDFGVNDFPEVDLAEVIHLSSGTRQRLERQQAAMDALRINGAKVSELELIKMSRDSIRWEEIKGTLPDALLDCNRKGLWLLDPAKHRTSLSLKLKNPSKANVLEAIRELEKRDDILSAQPSGYVSMTAALKPDDPEYTDGRQWAIDHIGLPEAWELTTDTKRICVGVMDSGIEATHRDFGDRVSRTWGISSVNDTSTYLQDPLGHGTHVAGIIGAVGNNSRGIAGVNWNVELVSLRIIGKEDNISLEWSAQAMDYAKSNGIPIINGSFGRYGTNENERNAINQYPGLMVFAAGNFFRDNDAEPFYPSSYDNPRIISVANTTSNDTLPTMFTSPPSRSNHGATSVDLAAPGTGIFSTLPDDLEDPPVDYVTRGPNESYGWKSGTSMAAPYVTGVASLIAGLANSTYINNTQLVKRILLNTVKKVEALERQVSTGGRLDARAAVLRAAGPLNLQKQTFVADVNGDGLDDMIVSRAENGKRVFSVFLGQADGTFSNTVTETTTTRNFFDTDPVFVGDVNGDGRADMIVHWSANEKRRLLVLTANADGTFDKTGKTLETDNTHNVNLYPCKFFVADVNGDGRADFIVHYGSGDTPRKRKMLVYLGQADGTFAKGVYSPDMKTRNYVEADPVFVGDVNGDGRADMIVHWASGGRRQLLVYTAKGDGSFNEGVNLDSANRHDSGRWPCKFFVADVNGDGRADFIVHWRAEDTGNRNNLVYLGQKNGTFADGIYALSSGNAYVEDDPVFIGDVNGDGRADMIVHWASGGRRQLLVYTANADGTYNSGVNFSSVRHHNMVMWPAAFFIAKTKVNNKPRDNFVVLWKDGEEGRMRLLTYAWGDTTFKEAVPSPAAHFPWSWYNL